MTKQSSLDARAAGVIGKIYPPTHVSAEQLAERALVLESAASLLRRLIVEHPDGVSATLFAALAEPVQLPSVVSVEIEVCSRCGAKGHRWGFRCPQNPKFKAPRSAPATPAEPTPNPPPVLVAPPIVQPAPAPKPMPVPAPKLEEVPEPIPEPAPPVEVRLAPAPDRFFRSPPKVGRPRKSPPEPPPAPSLVARPGGGAPKKQPSPSEILAMRPLKPPPYRPREE